MILWTHSTVTNLSKSSHKDYSVINQPSIQVCFTVTKRFNNLLLEVNPDAFSEKQLQTYRMIKSLYDKGLSYKKITKQLNDKGITTHKGNQWGVSGNSVYSVLKRYKEKQNRLKFLNKKYEPIYSKMWIE